MTAVITALSDELDDETLMLRYRDGDTAAFSDLYHRHKGSLYRYLLRQCNQETLAEELFQEVWLTLIRQRAGYQVRARFTTYLYRMARHRLIDSLRRNRRRAEYLTDDDPDTLDTLAADPRWQPEQQTDSALLADRLLAALGTLPDVQREVFLLRAEAGLSLEEIADVTGVTRETAKSRLRYALNKLRHRLETVNET